MHYRCGAKLTGIEKAGSGFGVLRLALTCPLPLCAGACDLPKDPDGATERVLATHRLRVGVSEHPPWVQFDGSEVKGLEPDLIRAFAAEMGAEVTWTRNSETPLLEMLEERQLDLVAAGFTSSSPWQTRVAATRPYLKSSERHILFAAPGENQLLLRLDRYLAGAQPQLATIKDEAKP
jgi:ABC-type amino acid transport substrate-binding protein